MPQTKAHHNYNYNYNHNHNQQWQDTPHSTRGVTNSAGAIRQVLSLSLPVVVIAVVVKLLLHQAYFSTDLEVHRNWLAITSSLPISKWYYEATSVWTLDYPPLFAWFQYAIGLPARWIVPEMLAVSNLDYHTWAAVLYLRATVVLSEVPLYIVAARLLFSTLRVHDANRFRVRFAAIVLHPGIFLVDNIHFQYNGLLYAFVLLVVDCAVRARFLTLGMLFATLINLKHIYLYQALAIFAYILAEYVFEPFARGSGSRKSTTTRTLNLWITAFARTAKMGIVVISVFAVSLAPFIKDYKQLLTRLFPFGRGLLHSYWAPNVWALYATLDWVLFYLGKIALRTLGKQRVLNLGLLSNESVLLSSIPVKLATTSGTVQQTKFVILPTPSAAVCAVLTAALQIVLFSILFILPIYKLHKSSKYPVEKESNISETPTRGVSPGRLATPNEKTPSTKTPVNPMLNAKNLTHEMYLSAVRTIGQFKFDDYFPSSANSFHRMSYFERQARLRRIVTCLTVGSWVSFLFGYHVHEKAVLLFVIPLTVLVDCVPKHAVGHIYTVACSSSFPQNGQFMPITAAARSTMSTSNMGVNLTQSQKRINPSSASRRNKMGGSKTSTPGSLSKQTSFNVGGRAGDSTLLDNSPLVNKRNYNSSMALPSYQYDNRDPGYESSSDEISTDDENDMDLMYSDYDEGEETTTTQGQGSGETIDPISSGSSDDHSSMTGSDDDNDDDTMKRHSDVNSDINASESDKIEYIQPSSARDLLKTPVYYENELDSYDDPDLYTETSSVISESTNVSTPQKKSASQDDTSPLSKMSTYRVKSHHQRKLSSDMYGNKSYSSKSKSTYSYSPAKNGTRTGSPSRGESTGDCLSNDPTDIFENYDSSYSSSAEYQGIYLSQLRLNNWFISLSLVSTLSLFPLLYEYNEFILKYSLTILYHMLLRRLLVGGTDQTSIILGTLPSTELIHETSTKYARSKYPWDSLQSTPRRASQQSISPIALTMVHPIILNPSVIKNPKYYLKKMIAKLVNVPITKFLWSGSVPKVLLKFVIAATIISDLVHLILKIQPDTAELGGLEAGFGNGQFATCNDVGSTATLCNASKFSMVVKIILELYERGIPYIIVVTRYLLFNLREFLDKFQFFRLIILSASSSLAILMSFIWYLFMFI